MTDDAIAKLYVTKSLVKSRESLVTQGEAIASSVKCTVYISTGETGLLSQQVLLHEKNNKQYKYI